MLAPYLGLSMGPAPSRNRATIHRMTTFRMTLTAPRPAACIRRTPYRTAALLLALAGCAAPSSVPAPTPPVVSSSPDDAKLEALMQRFWETTVEDTPLIPNVFGDLSHLDKLDRMSEAAFEERRAHFDQTIAALGTIDRSQLSDLNKTNRDMFEWVLKNERMLLDSPTRFFTFSTLGGWYSTLPQLVALTPFRTAKDYEDYIERLSKVGRFADEMIALSRRGIETGYVHPCDSLQGIADGVDKLIPSSAEASFAFGPAKRIPDHLENAEAIRRRLREVVEGTVTPAYQRYSKFFRSEYLPACRKTYGLRALEGGNQAYAELVRYYSTLADTTPNGVHELGLAEVKRIRTEMQAIVDQVGFEGDLDAFFKFNRTNPDFFTPDKDVYMARIAVISKAVDRQLPKYFAYIPRNRFALSPIPDAIAPRSSIWTIFS